MIFRHGFFHGDPHPANILLLDDGRIGLVDFGLAGRLSDEDMTRLTRLFIDAATENVDALPRRLAELGLRYPQEREEELRDAIAELFYRYYGSSVSNIDPLEVIREGLDLIYSLNLRLPTRFVILDKAIATLGCGRRRAVPRLQRVRGGAPLRAPAARRAVLAAADVAARPGRGARARGRRARAAVPAARRDGADAPGEARGPDPEPGLRRPHLPHRPRREPDRGGADRARRPRRLVDRRRPRQGRPSRRWACTCSRSSASCSRASSPSGSSGGSPGPGGCRAGDRLQPVVRACSRPCSRSSASTGSCGRARTTRPSRPVVSTAAQRALSTASSVASTVAAKSGSRWPSGTVARSTRSGGALVALGRRGREREEDLAAAVMGDRARPGEAEPGPPGEPLELRGVQRRVGGDDRDAASGRRARVEAVADRREHRHAVDPQVASRAEVREHEHADRRVDLGDEAARRADAALPAERDHAGARADTPLLDRAAARGGDRAGGVCRLDLHRARVVQPAVVALADDRDHDVVDADRRVGLAGDRHGAVEDAADRHRRGEVDRRLDQAPLGDLEEAGQLPGAVQGGDPGRNRAAEDGRPGAGQDRRDARARDPAPRGRRRLVARRPSRGRRGRRRRR